MDTPDSVTTLESALRAAIVADSHNDAARLLNAHAEAVTRSLRADMDVETIVALRDRATSTLEWAHLRIMAYRACAASELARIRSAGIYGPEPSSPITDLDA